MSIQTFNIPQADRLESVLKLIKNAGNGARTDVQLIANIPELKTDRQGRYYRKAAEILGFVTNQSNYAIPTSLGLQFMQNPTITNPLLINAVHNLEVIQKLIPYIALHPNGLTKLQIENYLQSLVVRQIGPSMLPRRVHTILSWLITLKSIRQRQNLFYLSTTFTQVVPVLNLNDIQQPILPTSGNLNEYQIVQRRIGNSQDIVTVYRNEAQMERSRQSHIALTNLIAERIRMAGGIPRSNELIDMATSLNEDYIFEMKSTTAGNERSQIRKGISQLYEYRYIQNRPSANLVLVVENPLRTPNNWMLDYVEDDREILMVWDGNNQLYGSGNTRNKLPFLNLQP